MTDKKISQLTAASTPLVGTEVAPIVQSNATVKATVDSFTSGRALTPLSVTQNGYVTPYCLFRNGIVFVYVSSGTMGDNGALSGISAAPVLANQGGYVYLPASAISAGSSAGWYYAVFSSTTAATVYNNVYSSGVPAIPSSPTAFVTTGPGAYTQTSGSWIAGMQITLPANSVGANGVIRTNFTTFSSASGNNKGVALSPGAIGDYFAFTNSVGIASITSTFLTSASGLTNRQTTVNVISGLNGSVASSTGPYQTTSADFTTAKTLTLFFLSASATESFSVPRITIDIVP